MSIVSESTYMDWSKSDTPASGTWKNPLRSNRQNLLVADAAVYDRDLTIANLRKQLAELVHGFEIDEGTKTLLDELEDARLEIMPFHQTAASAIGKAINYITGVPNEESHPT